MGDSMALQTIVVFGALLVMMLVMNLPVAFTLGLLAVGLLIYGGGFSVVGTIVTETFANMTNFVFIALPLFILMSTLLAASHMGDDLFDVANKWLGRLPGGLAMASTAAAAGFGTVCGSSAATVATMGMVALPAMKKHGYSLRLAMGTVASGGCLAQLIPPSMPMIIYGALTEQSIGQLFMAGAIPGVLMAVIFMIYIYILAIRRPDLAPAGEPATWRERFKILNKTLPIIVLMLFVLGGIYAGVVTPTEAAGVGAFVALVLGTVVYRRMNFRTLRFALLEALRVNSMICLILIGGLMFAHALLRQGIPQYVTGLVIGLNLSPWGVIVAMNIVWLILGMVVDGAALMLITLPVFFPIITALGFDPIWFGAVTVTNIELAILTPPVAINLFVTRAISGAPMSEVIKGTFPFMLLVALTLVLVIAFPPLSLWLPSTMIRR